MATPLARRVVLSLAAAAALAAAGWAWRASSAAYPGAAWRAAGVRPVQASGDGRWVWCAVEGRTNVYRRLRMEDGAAVGEVRLRPVTGPWARFRLEPRFVDLADGRAVVFRWPAAPAERFEVWTPGRAEAVVYEAPPPDAGALRAVGLDPLPPGTASMPDGGFASFPANAEAAPGGGVRVRMTVVGAAAGDPATPSQASRTVTVGGATEDDRYEPGGRPARFPVAASTILSWETKLEDFGLARPQDWLAEWDMRWTGPSVRDGKSAAAVWTRPRPDANFGVGRVPRHGEFGVALFGRDAAGRPRVVGQTQGGGGLDAGWLWGAARSPRPTAVVLAPGGRAVVIGTAAGRAHAFRFDDAAARR